MNPLFSNIAIAGNPFFPIDPLVKQTRAVLRIYREVKWAMEERQDELYNYLAGAGWNDMDTGIAYLTAFAPEITLQEFESRVCQLVENRIMISFIDQAIQSIRHYPEHGAKYHQIIQFQYLSHRRLYESEILDKLCLERSTFYRRKKEALLLLGLCLFGLLPKSEPPLEVEQLTLFEAC